MTTVRTTRPAEMTCVSIRVCTTNLALLELSVLPMTTEPSATVRLDTKAILASSVYHVSFLRLFLGILLNYLFYLQRLVQLSVALRILNVLKVNRVSTLSASAHATAVLIPTVKS
jgi:hypothetical protein